MTARRAAIVALVLLAGWVAANGALWYRTADFACLREGARLVAAGQDPYDATLWRDIVTTEHPDPFRGTAAPTCVARYASPLWTAVVMLPFGVLPLELAASLWISVAIAASVAGAHWIWQAARGSRRLAPLYATLVFASQPFWVILVGGQIGGLLLGLLGAGVALEARGRPGVAGAALGALALKPQVAGPLLAALAVRDALARRWRLVAGAAATGVVLLAVSVALQPGWVPRWLEEVAGRRLGYAGLLPTAWGLSNDLFGTVAWAPVLVVAAAALCWAIVRGREVGTVAFAGLAVALGLFAAPHVWSYDFVVLALPWGVTLAIADRMDGPRRAAATLLAVLVASLVPWAFYAIAFARGQENWSALVPVAAAVALATALRLQRAPVSA